VPYLLGTDEAGYGPSLGPLVIAATAWHVPERCTFDDLYPRLAKVIAAELDDTCSAGGRRLALVDSKVAYKSTGTLELLERGVLSALRLAGCAPANWREAWLTLYPKLAAQFELLPWHSDFELALPLAADLDDVECVSRSVAGGLRSQRVRLAAIRGRPVFPDEFNDRVDDAGSKGAVLSDLTMQLVADLVEMLPDEPIVVLCDKHGGRNYYAALVQQQFPSSLVQIVCEGRDLSVYRVEGGRVEFHFRPRAESSLPAALASMVAKYFRELAMYAFNEFWRTHIPDLRRTAGYTQDARRFKRDIAVTQAQLGIDDRILWRSR
jgi:ribonuclease HII